jgi:ferredoxin
LLHTADFYLCSPEAFTTALRSSLTRLGVAANRIHFELFGPGAKQTSAVTLTKPHPPAGAAQASGPTVTFARSGLTVRWDSHYANLLELTEACDVPARWSCRSGICHNCESRLLEGAVEYSTAPLDPPGSGVSSFAVPCLKATSSSTYRPSDSLGRVFHPPIYVRIPLKAGSSFHPP